MHSTFSKFQIIFWLFLICLTPDALLSQTQPQRIALVIGNTDYTYLPKLRNASSDAFSVARVLSAKGFTVFFAEDVTGSEFKETLDFVSKRTTSADQILVYYAGHSKIQNGTTELLPVNGNGTAKTPLTTSVSVTDVLASFNVPFAQKAFILDTCLEAEAESIHSLQLPKSMQLETLLVFATSFGHAAYDGAGAHSVFTGTFLDYLSNGHPDLETTIQIVRRDVIRNSRSNQTPVSVSTLTRPFVLKSKTGIAQRLGTQNDLIQSYSSSGYSGKSLLKTISVGISPVGLIGVKSTP